MKRHIDMVDTCIECGKKYSPPDFIWHCCCPDCKHKYNHDIANGVFKKFFAENPVIKKEDEHE